MAFDVRLIDGVDSSYYGDGQQVSSGTAASNAPGPAPAAASQGTPGRDFDLSPIAGLRDSARFGDNLVGDIKSSYQTYISGSAVGRGGQYATDAARKYGVSIREAAAGYLQAAGLGFLADAVSPSPAPPSIPTPPITGAPTTPAPATPTTPDRNIVEQLLDVFPRLFGEPVYNPPLQQQATSYTPVESGASGGSSGGGLTMILVLAAVAVAGYFIYKKVKG